MLTKTGSIIETDGGRVTLCAQPSGSVVLTGESGDIPLRTSMDLNGLFGGSRSQLGDSITFSPLKDSELQRRARNNDILAKIQELEANASVQAARSERLRMMREEYEGLVKKYASSYRWPLRTSNFSNGNGYYPNANHYQPSNFHQPHVTFNSGGDAPLLLPNVPLSSTQLIASQQTRHELAKSTHTFSTIGVNTDITGPVRPLLESDVKENGREWNRVHFEGEKVNFITPIELHSPQTQSNPEVPISAAAYPPALFTSSPYLVQQPSQSVNKREDRDEKTVSSQKTSISMQMMLLDEEDDEDSFSHRRQSERSQNLRFYNFQQPKAPLVDDTVSISTMSSPGDNGNSPSYTTTESGLKKRKQTEKKLEKMGKRKENETSVESSFAGSKYSRRQDDVGNVSDKGSKYTKHDMTDVSLSDSSARQIHGRQRKVYLEQLSGGNKLEHKDDDDDQDLDDSTDKDCIIKTKAKHNDGDDDDLLCSSPPTAGATSESLGESLLDSVHKTPDALPRDDSELHGIAEVKEDDEEDAIELEDDNKVSHDLMERQADDDFVVHATAVQSPDKCITTHSGVNDTLPMSSGDKEGESHERINDAEETRSNNLSSSKLDVPAENEEGNTADGSHANNPVENNGQKNLEQGNISTDGDVKPMEERVFDENGELDNTRMQGEIMSAGTDAANGGNEISKEKRDMSFHASSANLAHSSTSSSFSGANGVSRETNLRKEFAANHMKVSQRLSSGSSSPSSSRQQSFDEQWDNAGRQGPNGSKGKVLTTQSTNKRQHQSEQVKGGREASPVGADQVPERLSPKSPQATSPGRRVTAQSKTLDTNPGKTGETSPKTAKNLASSLSPTSSTSSNGRRVDKMGSSGNGVTNFRSPRTFSNLKQTIPPAPATTGPTGAKNTARRVRLKLNYDDSESDSSEIGPVKALPGLVAGSVTRNQFSVSSSQPQGSLAKETGLATSGKIEEKGSVKNQPQDDDFDDFFDI